jgi:ATP-dependent RNA helicase RhlE
MLDMGFIHDIRRILERLPVERQSLLFSATFSPHIRRLAEDLLREPVSIDVAPRNAAAAPIRQVVHPVDRTAKRHLLTHMLRRRGIEQVLVFTRTKRGASRLAEQLVADGIHATAIHGNKSQSQRVRALGAFRKGDAQVLVATDIAARGLDIESLPHVINFELPSVPEDYVHRIGRTGRAGQAGTAISLMAVEEQDLMQAIERLLKRPIEREVIDGFEPSFTVPAATGQDGRRSGPRARHGSGDASRRRRAAVSDHQPGRPAAPGGRPSGRTEASGHSGISPHQHPQARSMPGERLSGHRTIPDRRQDREDAGRRS